MFQKIIQVGNSGAVVLPKSVMEEMGITVGNKIKLTTSKKSVKIEIVSIRKKVDPEIIDREVYQVAKNLLRRYLPAFKALAKK